jgi:hypothetical protein
LGHLVFWVKVKAKMKSLSAYFVFFCLLTLSVSGQEKYEREYRLAEEDIPAVALAFVDSCHFSKRIRWYGEESLMGPSIEAKVKENKIRHSIEFDTLGQIQDVELKIDWQKIPASARSQMEKYFTENFTKHRVVKVQRQWTGPPETLIALIRGESTQDPFITKYEVVLRGRTEAEQHDYEILFGGNGQFEKRSMIVHRNTDNLDY